MAEPRARQRGKGAVFSAPDLSDLLYAFGDNTRTPQTPSSLSSTISTLDEILTDFVIESCHAAALSASYSRRQKIKVEDFKWVLRKDERLLGRALESLARERWIRDQRKTFNAEEMDREGGGGGAIGQLEGLAETGGVGGEMKKKRRKKRKTEDEDGRVAKRREV